MIVEIKYIIIVEVNPPISIKVINFIILFITNKGAANNASLKTIFRKNSSIKISIIIINKAFT